MLPLLATFLNTPEAWAEILKGYGLGILTLAYFIWHLQGELKEARARETKSEEALLALTKETLASIANLSKVVESLTPAIGTLSQSHKDQIERSTLELKSHLTSMCDQLKKILKDDSRN